MWVEYEKKTVVRISYFINTLTYAGQYTNEGLFVIRCAPGTGEFAQ